MSATLVELVRSGLVDGVQRGDLAVVSADGELRASVGDPEQKIAFWRSAAKPFQAMPLIVSGAASRLGLATEDIALMAASHGGEPIHIARAASLLVRVGHRVADLECGHTQHMRHTPPWQNRPWITTAEGRARFIGTEVRCTKCASATSGRG